MNERLEQGIADWFDVLDDYCKRTDYTINDIKDTARHFYNFALEDVRKYVREMEERNFKYFQEKLLTPESLSARDAQIMALRDYIDTLTK